MPAAVACTALATERGLRVSLAAMQDIVVPQTDRELVAAVLAARPGAFELLVRQYQNLCWYIIQRMVRHPEDTRELCQETFLRVHQCLAQYRYESALKSWIGQVAYSVAKRHLERRRIPLLEPQDDEDMAVVESVGDGFDVEADVLERDSAAHLHRAIETLSPLQRTVLTLYHLEEMPISEIAAITGLAEGTIKSHLFRSRKHLREQLEPIMGVAV